MIAKYALIVWIAASFLLLAVFYGFSKYINEPLAMVSFIMRSLIIQSFFQRVYVLPAAKGRKNPVMAA
jgi:hypothetical protein